MARKRSYHPTLDRLEGRVALSSNWFSGIFGSVFGKVGSHHSSSHGATRAAHGTGSHSAQLHHQQVLDARAAKRQQLTAREQQHSHG